MENGIFDGVNKLLAEYDFGMNENIPDNVKCLKCGKILINACYVPCGCRYCRVCVDGFVESDCRVCPGNTEFCRISDLLNIQLDYRIQNEISKIVVKCPEEMCLFECELINMNEHLRVCPNKSVKCVFYGLGCDQSNVATANMNEHLQLANYSHMEMLMGIIDNMRNEIAQLKESDERKKTEIEKLKENDERNKNEIEILKENDERNKNEIEILKGDSVIKAEKIESLEEKIKLMKMEKIDNLERKIWKTVAKMDAGPSKVRQERGDALERNKAVLKETNSRYQTDMETRISVAEKWMDKLIDGTFVLTIDNVAQRRQNDEGIKTGYFYAKMRPYKMTLTMWVNGADHIFGTGLSIYLWIYSDLRSKYIKWSLPADVSIRIVNKANPNACKSITKRYTIKKPNDNSSYRLNNHCDFDFLYADLYDASLLIGDCFIVECHVNVGWNK